MPSVASAIADGTASGAQSQGFGHYVSLSFRSPSWHLSEGVKNMDNELRYFLQQGPTTAKELARVTGKSTSTIYKALKAGRESGDILVHDDANGDATRFYVKPDTEAPEDGQGATAAPKNGQTPTDATPVAPAHPSKPEKRGRKATAAGLKLYLGENMRSEDGPGSSFTWINPRRAGSAGFKSLQIIIDTPGILTEDFVKAGGRLNDLRWDLAHGNVRAE
jgi:hypothetical protein